MTNVHCNENYLLRIDQLCQQHYKINYSVHFYFQFFLTFGIKELQFYPLLFSALYLGVYLKTRFRQLCKSLLLNYL
jgi:hypothetical protein